MQRAIASSARQATSSLVRSTAKRQRPEHYLHVILPTKVVVSSSSLNSNGNNVPTVHLRTQPICQSGISSGSTCHSLPSTTPPPRRFATTSVKPKTPMDAYNAAVAAGEIQNDEKQLVTIQRLQKLYEDLKNAPPPVIPTQSTSSYSSTTTSASSSSSGGFFSSLFGSKPTTPSPSPFSSTSSSSTSRANLKPNPNVPKGVYIYGGVGCGKTMMMDMFFETVPPSVKKVCV